MCCGRLFLQCCVGVYRVKTRLRIRSNPSMRGQLCRAGFKCINLILKQLDKTFVARFLFLQVGCCSSPRVCLNSEAKQNPWLTLRLASSVLVSRDMKYRHFFSISSATEISCEAIIHLHTKQKKYDLTTFKRPAVHIPLVMDPSLAA